MKKDKHITEVVFRVDTTKSFKGIIFALFPYEVDNLNGNVNSYQHVGQHSSADYTYCINNSKPATKKQAKDLKAELSSIGYNLKVIQKRSYKKYFGSFRKTIKSVRDLIETHK